MAIALFNKIPLHMDYVGQQKAETIARYIVSFFAISGFIYGYYVQQFSYTVYTLTAGYIIACMVMVPPWPCYRKNPLPWQPVSTPINKDEQESNEEESNVGVEHKAPKNKNKKKK